MCTAKDSTLQGEGKAVKMPSKHVQSQRPSSASFMFIIVLSLTSTYSAILQLEKVYYDGIEDQKFIYKVPYIADLKIPESFAFCTFTVFVLGWYVSRQLSFIQRAKLNMPVVPSYIPFLGTALQMLTNTPWDLMESWHRTYGPIYSFKLLGVTCVSTEKPEHIKEFLQSKIQNVKKDVQFAYKPFLCILGKGIVTSEGKQWMDQRRKISHLLKVHILELIPHATLGAIQRLMVKLDACAASEGARRSTVDISEELRHLTLQVISECFLSLEADESDTTFATMYLPIVEESNQRVWRPERSFMFFMPFFWRHLYGIRRLNNYVSKLIQDRWDERKKEGGGAASKKRNDILGKVLEHFEKEHPGVDLDSKWIRQLRDEFKTFMLAGHETSAAMMTWAFFELMKNGDLRDQVNAEAATIFGERDWLHGKTDELELPSREELSGLVFSEGCLRESLRLYSVVPVTMRQTVKDMKVGNHIIPGGSRITINMQSVHHNEEYWPDPLKFDPTRFTDPKSTPAPYTFLPFIDGPRNCLGQYLALLESKMVISLLSQRYEFEFADKAMETDQDPRHRFIVPIIPKGNLDVFVSKM